MKNSYFIEAVAELENRSMLLVAAEVSSMYESAFGPVHPPGPVAPLTKPPINVGPPVPEVTAPALVLPKVKDMLVLEPGSLFATFGLTPPEEAVVVHFFIL